MENTNEDSKCFMFAQIKPTFFKMNFTKTFGLSIKEYIKIRSIILFMLLNFMFSQVSFSHVRLPKLVSNGMILQRETPVTIRGFASAGEQVTVNFNNSTFTTVTAIDKKWEIILPSQSA